MCEPWPNTARAKQALMRHVAHQGGMVQLVGEVAPYAIASPFSLAPGALEMRSGVTSLGKATAETRALFERTSTVLRAYLDRTLSVLPAYLELTSSVLRAYLECTSTAPPPHLPFGIFFDRYLTGLCYQ